MVTTVIIPALKRSRSKEEQIESFEKKEGKFSLQAKVTTVLTGVSGIYIVEVLNAWGKFLDIQFWWVHAMVWFIFTIILFILEPCPS